jgi:ATP-dependent Clp protease protease subunit
MNEIFIYDDIGPDWLGMVGAKGIVDQLKKFGNDADVEVRINSPGGSVTEGQAIYNAFARHKGKVRMVIDSLAASMGSYIAMAGDEIEIAENAMLMVHNPWTLAMGDAAELRQTADVLEKFQSSSTEVYARRSGQKFDKVRELMDSETWLTAQEAVDLGFADSVGQEMKDAQAKVKEGRFAKTPARFLLGAGEALPREERRASRIEHAQRSINIARSRLGV